MKTKVAATLLITILALVLPAAGQSPDRRRAVLPAPPQPVPAPPQMQPQPQPMVRPGGQTLPQSAAELPHNVKLSLEGSLFGTIPTDFSVTAGGTTVSSDMTLESKETVPTIGSFQAVITPGDPWLVLISIGAQVPIQSGNGNIQYKSSQLNTTVRIAPGKKVVLWEKGDQKLTLSMEKVED